MNELEEQSSFLSGLSRSLLKEIQASVLKMLSVNGLCGKVVVSVVKNATVILNVVFQPATGNMFRNRVKVFSGFDLQICV